MVRSRLLQATIRHVVSNRSSSSPAATTIASTANGLIWKSTTMMTGIESLMEEQQQKLPNQKGFTSITTKRFFSSESSSSSEELLSAILKRELDEEMEEGDYTSPPPELADLEKDIKENWTIVTSSSDALGGGGGGGNATIKMYKKEATSNGSKVSILFHCQDTLPSEDGDDGSGSSGGGFLDTGYVETDDGDQDEEEESAAVRFTLIVSKAGKVMIMKCVSEDAEAVVEGLAVVGEEQMTVTGKEGEVDEMLYQGPEFSELAEDLQEAFTAYVRNECGVNTDVAAFIAMYADYKEQMEYVSWLKSVKSVVS